MIVTVKKKSSQYLHGDLMRRINERQLLPGTALPSENAIAADYGVSRPTVRKALEMLELSNLIVRRPGIGSFVSDIDKNGEIRTQKTLTLGTDIFGGDAGFYHGLILNGTKRGCEKNGCRLTLVNKNDMASGSFGLDGLVLAGTTPDDYTFYRELAVAGLPVVLINRFPGQPELAYLSVDYVIESEKAVEYLLSLGHRDIAVIGADFDGSVTGMRTRGWEQAFQRRGLIPPRHLCYSFADMRYADHDKLTEFLRTNRFSALFVTLGALIPKTAQALGLVGLRVPDDVSMMCFDDMEETLKLLGIPVSYVKMPLDLMGEMAVEYLVRRNRDFSTQVMRKLLQASLVTNSGCRAVTEQ